MSFCVRWDASNDIGVRSTFVFLSTKSSFPSEQLDLSVYASDSYGASKIGVALKSTSGTFTRSNPPNILSNGIKIVTCRSVYPSYPTALALFISSDSHEIISFGGGGSGFSCQAPDGYMHTGSSGVIVDPNPVPDMSQYLKSSDVEILKTRLLALKTEFTRLESKWSRLDQFSTDLENFNRVLDGYKNTIPPESYVKLSSVVEKLKAALK